MSGVPTSTSTRAEIVMSQKPSVRLFLSVTKGVAELLWGAFPRTSNTRIATNANRYAVLLVDLGSRIVEA